MIRVGVVSPEPTPYRSPLFDRLALEDEIDLTVVYAAESVAARRWTVKPAHRYVTLRGVALPTTRMLHHAYPVTPGIWSLLSRERFDVLVVAGWSLFASQAAVVWSRLHHVPYVLMSESHLLDPRPSWVAALKRFVVPRIVRPAAGWLATGSLSKSAFIDYGADASRVRVFANTIDIEAMGSAVRRARRERAAGRARLGFGDDDVVVISVGRLDAVKGVDTLVRAVAQSRSALALLVVGDGPERAGLASLARELGVRAVFTGFADSNALPELYAIADVFALLSHSEPWGVVVNEAAAAGLPLVLSDRVGAAADLLVAGENGLIVPPSDPAAAAAALRALAADRPLRESFGRTSRSIAAGWGYEPSIWAFLTTVREAVRR